MKITTSLSQSQQHILHDLRLADRCRLKAIFNELPAPNIDELDGEYAGELLDQGNWLANWLVRRFFRMAGNWTGKAFQGTGSDRGIGYNCFLQGSKKIKRLPMFTYIEETPSAGRAFVLDYSLTTRGPIRSMRGRVRRMQMGVYLGFGTAGPSFGKHGSRRKMPFVLVGPNQPFELPSNLLHLRESQRASAA